MDFCRTKSWWIQLKTLRSKLSTPNIAQSFEIGDFFFLWTSELIIFEWINYYGHSIMIDRCLMIHFISTNDETWMRNDTILLLDIHMVFVTLTAQNKLHSLGFLMKFSSFTSESFIIKFIFVSIFEWNSLISFFLHSFSSEVLGFSE